MSCLMTEWSVIFWCLEIFFFYYLYTIDYSLLVFERAEIDGGGKQLFGTAFVHGAMLDTKFVIQGYRLLAYISYLNITESKTFGILLDYWLIIVPWLTSYKPFDDFDPISQCSCLYSWTYQAFLIPWTTYTYCSPGSYLLQKAHAFVSIILYQGS